METTVFNPIQRHLLEMFSYDKYQEGLEDRNLLSGKSW